MGNVRSGEIANRGGGRVSLVELMQQDDEDFVRGAYLRILGRPADETEVQSWVAPMRSGELSKVAELIAMRYSAEGRARGVTIPGLAVRRFARAFDGIPFLGYVARWFRSVILLPKLVQRVNASETVAAASRRSSQLVLTRMQTDQELRLGKIEQHKADTATVTRAMAAIETALRRMEDAKADAAAVAREFGTLTADVRRMEISKAAADDFREATARLGVLAAEVATNAAALRTWSLLPYAGSTAGGETDPLDTFYRRFEDRFRGTREEIRARLEFYMPFIVSNWQTNPSTASRFVDIGCGRGEMLEMLRQGGVPAYGIDRSEAMVSDCRALGLDVVRADALDHLRTLPSDSCAGAISIHVIEHLPFRSIAALFGEVLRILRPGAIAIFETPNPENLIVGACNFYIDPTHVRPLPPAPMRFALEAMGYERVTIERLHPGTSLGGKPETAEGVAGLYRMMMEVPQDYALIAYKPVAVYRHVERGTS